MVVEVRFVGVFRSLAGKGDVDLEFRQPVDMEDVTRAIMQKFPRFKMLLVDSEMQTFKSNLLVLVNGREIGVLNGLRTAIKDGDEVVFVPVVHGG